MTKKFSLIEIIGKKSTILKPDTSCQYMQFGQSASMFRISCVCYGVKASDILGFEMAGSFSIIMAIQYFYIAIWTINKCLSAVERTKIMGPTTIWYSCRRGILSNLHAADRVE
jgi:hypothetical protein